ncbi:RNA polymerase sigma factor [Pueribacillus theae]|uniref:RNA polymerase sigma factor n=1 Tax=Pueribacillus theae TaxID=2171751 RepID=A0A2U1JZ03_9BACI|nr:RNA polymerase sigma factor [Pueribacillus theae]PWA10028.1 RNA polymerase sigma factor [Pueribacillus theae]
MTDEELLEQMANGNQAAFEALIHRYHSPLFSYLERKLHDPQKAEDFTQETFLKLIRQLKAKKQPNNLKPWLYQVATNLCRDYWKSAFFRSEKQELDRIPEPKDSKTSIIEIYEKQEERKEILASLSQLSETQKEIVLLRFYQDLKYKEIAAALDLPIGTVKSNLFHALKKLKTSLKSFKITKESDGDRRNG